MAIELRKGSKISLEKKGSTLGEVHINLNWKQPTKKGFFAKRPQAIDLDLGCLYELKDGRKSAVQALGNRFGAYTEAPYIMLDGDDRSGAAVGGENLRINGAKLSEIKRILVYTFIYEGTVDWSEAQAVATIRVPGAEEIVVHLDEYGSPLKNCSLVLLENQNDESFSVEKVVGFFPDNKAMDAQFSWGLPWTKGKK